MILAREGVGGLHRHLSHSDLVAGASLNPPSAYFSHVESPLVLRALRPSPARLILNLSKKMRAAQDEEAQGEAH